MFVLLFMFKDNGVKFMYDESKLAVSNNIMDRWILSFVQSLVVFFEKEMSGKLASEELCVCFLITTDTYSEFL